MALITRSDELRYANRARVLASLRADGRQSRKLLAKSTGLSAATITQVTAGLIEEQIIIESRQGLASDLQPGTNLSHSHSHKKVTAELPATAPRGVVITPSTTTTTRQRISNRRGRPQVVLEMIADAAIVATITMNFDWIEVTLFDYKGTLLLQQSSAISQTRLSGKALLGRVQKTMQSVLTADPLYCSRLKHITVACQGRVSKQHGDLLWSPLSQAEKIGVGRFLQSQFGVSVSVDNDCNMIASALYKSKLPVHQTAMRQPESAARDAAKGGNFAAVLMSYGIGLGLIHEGAILTGSRSSGTELGHMQISADGPLCRCGKLGCIEAYAADYAIWRRAHGLNPDQLPETSIDQDGMHKIICAARSHDGIERLALREAGDAIGQGLANLFAIFDSFPTRLVGLDENAAPFVAEAIYERLQASGDADAEDIVSVHNEEGEIELIRKGAVMQCLNFVDQQIFSFGTPQSVINS